MLGLMQQQPLLISSLLNYTERYHAGIEIVSRAVEGPIQRSNWGTVASRAKRLANALRRCGVAQSERVHFLSHQRVRKKASLSTGQAGNGAVTAARTAARCRRA